MKILGVKTLKLRFILVAAKSISVKAPKSLEKMFKRIMLPPRDQMIIAVLTERGYLEVLNLYRAFESSIESNRTAILHLFGA